MNAKFRRDTALGWDLPQLHPLYFEALLGQDGEFTFTIADLLGNDPGGAAKVDVGSQFSLERRGVCRSCGFRFFVALARCGDLLLPQTFVRRCHLGWTPASHRISQGAGTPPRRWASKNRAKGTAADGYGVDARCGDGGVREKLAEGELGAGS